MAGFTYNYGKLGIANQEIDCGDGGDTLKAFLVMEDTTCDTEKDVETNAGFTDEDEFDGDGYSIQTLGSKAISVNLTDDRVEFDCADIDFGDTVDAGTSDIVGIVVYKDVGGVFANGIPIAYIEVDPQVTPYGEPISMAVNAEGWLQL